MVDHHLHRVLISFLAGTAGGFIITTRMKVLATGVMVLLALVPSIGLVGAGLALGEWDLAGGALVRWLADVACILLGGGGVIAAKRAIFHPGPSGDG